MTFKVSAEARRIAADLGRKRKMPKPGVDRLLSGDADSEPTLQAFGELEEGIRTQHAEENKALLDKITELETELAKLKEEQKTDLAHVAIYRKALLAIIARTNRSIFGMAKAIREAAQNAYDLVEGPYH